MPADMPHDVALPPGGAAVRRARPIYRVFVSSTWLDLQPERRALMEALNRMEEMRFVGMEFFGNRPDDTHDASIDQVDLCEVFIGIIGFRYGSGITEAEYRRARALNLPCFVYFKRGEATSPDQTDNDPALAAKLAAFKQDLLRGHTVKEVGSPEELAASATADLHNWVAARWISLERETTEVRPAAPVADADRTNILRLIERIDQDWIKGVLEASLHHRAWLDLGLDWREDAVEHPWDRIVVAPNRPIQTLSKEDSISGVFDAAQHTLLVLGEPGAGKTTTVLELARDLIARARKAATEPAPVVLALSTWRGQHKNLMEWLVAELGLRYQVPKRVARTWLEEGRLVLILDGLDEVVVERRAACVEAINAFEQDHHPRGLAVTCRVAEYNALTTKLRLRSAICLQPLTPAQIDRYFQAAGSSLDPLRRALQEDAGLRELARSPLMLSVMTMAWRDAPAETTAPFAAAQTPEELRRRLFDAYVQAALHRRGKASGGYTPEQTERWLTWLAKRMKEHGHTLFALEQLQPGWLEGTWRQFGYFLGSRLLGTIGLVLPFLFYPQAKGQAVVAAALSALGLAAGCYLGTIDFAFARHGWGGHWRAMLRLWSTLLGLMFLTVGWMALSPDGPAEGAGTLYLFMVALAFCAPVDVRALDIKPAGSIQWSRDLASSRTLSCVGVLVIILLVIRLLAVQSDISDHGWARGWLTLGGWSYVAGLVAGGALALGAARAFIRWPQLRPFGWKESWLAKVICALLGGQIGAVIAMIIGAMLGPRAGTSDGAIMANAMTFLAMFPTLLFYLFGGFGSTLIDPARPQQAGPWFWLRVPVLAFLMLGGVVLIPGLAIVIGFLFGSPFEMILQAAAGVALFSAGCGLVAFLRFGGFNGAQHFLLRWLLARSGHLPARAEAFLRHAAQLALLQKVGLGYRFVHALLLQHLAAGGPEAAGPVAVSPVQTSRLQKELRVAASVGLGLGLMLLAWMGIAGAALALIAATSQGTKLVQPLFGLFMLSTALAVPVLLLTGRWFGRLPWRWLGAGWFAVGLGLAWLVWDEPARPRSASLEQAATDFPEAPESYAVLIRHDARQPSAKRFKWNRLSLPQSSALGQPWRELIADRRAEIEANWIALAPVRQWVAELNAFGQIADLDANLLDFSQMNYQAREPLLQNTMAIACIQALEGKGDEALATLQPLLEVGGKIEAGARGLGYLRDGRAMQNAAIRAAGFVLDHSRVSAEARGRFASALTVRGGGPAGARRSYAIRFAMMEQAGRTFGTLVTTADSNTFEFVRPALDLAGPVAYNREASLNRWHDHLAELADLAAHRKLDQEKMQAAGFPVMDGTVRIKNLGSAWLVQISRNARWEVLVEPGKAYWEAEDRRGALLARLQQP